jgi:hypothetical protein
MPSYPGGKNLGDETTMPLKLTSFQTHFGKSIRIPMPPDCNVMVVCVNEGYGLMPLRVSLPHQLYESTVKEILAEHPAARWITCIPARSEDYVDVWESEYEHQSRIKNRKRPA